MSPIFTPDGGHYFIILPQREGDAGYYRHIAMVDAANVVNVSTVKQMAISQNLQSDNGRLVTMHM